MERRETSAVCFLVLVLLLTAVPGEGTDLTLGDNGYEGVIIVIGDDVKEDGTLIQRIKDVFTEASSVLFYATDRRAYFRNISIVIPQQWASTGNVKGVIRYINEFKEHIRVNRRNKTPSGAPYVRGNVACGKPGWYMHLTPEFLYQTGITDYGKHSKAVVHEWGHLRWGLFDEYPSMDIPVYSKRTKPSTINFYQKDGKWRPVTCSSKVQGHAYRYNCGSAQPCDHYLQANQQPPRECKFCPLSNQDSSLASLMSEQWITNMVKFCDVDSPTTPDYYRHNSEAPNLQNKVCNGQSAWEVMRQHEDFKNGTNPSLEPGQNLQPVFNIYRRSPRIRVFVLDVSGSMGGIVSRNDNRARIEHLHQAAVFVIDNIIETYSYLGIISFNSVPHIAANMTFIGSQATRDRLKDGVPRYANGGTNIHSALKAAEAMCMQWTNVLNICHRRQVGNTNTPFQVVSVSGKSPPGSIQETAAPQRLSIDNQISYHERMLEATFSYAQETEIILISDGESDPVYTTLGGPFANKGIIVHTIAISNSADQHMKGIATQTGGGSYTYLETDTVSLADVLGQVISAGQTSSDSSQRLYVESKLVTNTITDEFNIDEGMGRDTVIVVLLDTRTDVFVSMEIVGPDNVQHHRNGTTKMLRLEIAGTIPAGMYEYTVNMSSGTAIQAEISVKSYPLSDTSDVIRVTSRLSDTLLNFKRAEEIKLYVTVEKGGIPVLGATVRAVLAADSSVDPRNISLKDSGTGPDARANDGIYSAYLLKKYFIGRSQRFNAKVLVTGDSETFIFSTVGGSAPIPGAVAEPVYQPQEVGSFQRQSFPQEIVVLNYDPGQATLDTTPPAQITDLSLTNIKSNQGQAENSITYTLTWTAVGDDMDIGQAANYSLRMDKEIRKLRNFFNISTAVNTTMGTPKPAGETEVLNVTLTLQDCNGTCYLALTATDSSGLESSPSNIVVVDVDFSYKSLEEVELDDSTTEEDDSGDGIVGMIAVIAVVSAVGCLFVAIIVAIGCRIRRTSSHPSTNGTA